MYLAGIDIGTTSICCVLADGEQGGIVKVAARPNDSALHSVKPWEKLQDPERIMALVEELLRECCEDVIGEIAAIGISCQMHGIVYVDRNGDKVSPLYTWQDRRGDEPFAPDMTFTSRLGQLTGTRVSTGFGMVTHFYQTHHGMVPKDAFCLCSIGDYVAMKLCNAALPVTDASNAASFGLFSLAERNFDRSAMEKAGLDPAILPLLSEHVGAVAGKTPEGIPVICAIGDNQASFLGTVPRLDHSLLINIGTGAQISLFAEQPADLQPLEARPFPGGGYLLVGASLGGGKTYALLERFLQEACRTFGAIDGGSLYETMNRLAEEAMDEGGEPPTVNTQFFGTRHNPGATGSILNISEHNFTPSYLILGILGGIADELMGFIKQLPQQLSEAISTVSGSGNGIRKNMAMRRLLQSRFHVPFLLTDVEEGAAYGAAIHAGIGCGLFPDYNDALTKMGRSSRHKREGGTFGFASALKPAGDLVTEKDEEESIDA